MAPAEPVSAVTEGKEQVTSSPIEQREPLLRAKLFVPLLRPDRVSRPRLIERINRGLEKSLILISAPAGYGKTTLVSSWLQVTKIPSAWISLDEGDNDPIRFLQNFIVALDQIAPASHSDLPRALKSIGPAPLDAMLHIVFNEIAGRATPFILVLDDFHLIHSQPILDTLAYLLEHMPPQMHLVLITRTDPPMPLSRLRARNQLAEIRAEQLRFTNEEVAVFLYQGMGLKLSADDIDAMEARTEGWIAGLQLAALSMLNCKNIHSFVAAFAGSHYYIMDYLTEEVLKLQPERVRRFLLETSILTSMCAPLCEAVVNREGTEPVHGQAMLESLEQMNLFVTPLDDSRGWYRYHHLFTEVLVVRLEHLYPERLPELHLRASQWYEGADMISEAIQHALKAGDQRRVAHLVEQHGCSVLMSGEGFTLLKWAEAVGPSMLRHPWLAILKAWALALTGYKDQVEPTLRTAEELLSALEPSILESVEGKIMLGSLATVRAYLANSYGNTNLAADYAQGALECLPDSDAFSCSLRSVATSILGDASWINGNLDQARQAYEEAVQISRAAGNIYMNMITSSNLADVLAEKGELHQAAHIYTDILRIATRADGQKISNADRIYRGLSEIFYEWNDLEAASQYVHPCIELCRRSGNSSLLARAYILLARVERARNDPDAAWEAIRAAEQIANEQPLGASQSRWVKFAVARWWLTERDFDRANHLLQESGVASDSITRDGITLDGTLPRLQEPEAMLLLRLSLAQGDYEAALRLTGHLLSPAKAARRTGRVIEILVLQALALQGKRETAQAMSVLSEALSLAQPGGFVRVFLDEGEPIARLLYQVRSQNAGRGYAS